MDSGKIISVPKVGDTYKEVINKVDYSLGNEYKVLSVHYNETIGFCMILLISEEPREVVSMILDEFMVSLLNGEYTSSS